MKLPAAQWVEYVKIDWEMPASGVPTPKKYTIEAAEKEGGEFTVVHTNSEQVTKAEQVRQTCMGKRTEIKRNGVRRCDRNLV